MSAERAKRTSGTQQLTRALGRPTVYLPEMCDLVEEMGREGRSKAEMAAALNVTRETLYAWARTRPDFSDALARAEEFSLAWWEEQGRKGLSIPAFNAGLYAKAMGGRFPREPYRERVEVSANVQVQERAALDPRTLEPDMRGALRQILTVALAQLQQPEVIEGEAVERE